MKRCLETTLRGRNIPSEESDLSKRSLDIYLLMTEELVTLVKGVS
jgi:hypothetical protein